VAKPDWYTLQAQWLKALAHPVRLKILEEIRGGEACVCHLEAMLGYRQAYLSQQLGVLRRAGLLAERKDGLFVFYRVAGPEVTSMLDAARLAVGQQPPGGAHPARRRPSPRAETPSCDCPHCRQAREVQSSRL
jgi:ArsR family transcriptional regulator